MSSKPSDPGRFAVSTLDVDATNISAPSSGLRDTGFPTNAIPTSGNVNYLENLAYRWRKYLSDGAFSGASTFDSTVGITGAATFGSTVGVTGAATFGSTVGITGATSVTGLLTANGGATVSGVITANGGLTTSSGITLTSSAEIHFPPRELPIAITAFTDIEAGSTSSPISRIVGGVSDVWWALNATGIGSGVDSILTPIPLNVGDRILSVLVQLVSGNPVPVNGTFLLANHDYVTGITTTASATLIWPVTINSSRIEAITLNHTIATGECPTIIIKTGSVSGTALVGRCTVFWDHP